ncbi:2-hydroxyacyl-CoA dehydratase, partial [candidate division WOR-3 bacterium]|nr:2-hydroxyacyl-CoA dehydratase [candidate division WOR-3 bacterium]
MTQAPLLPDAELERLRAARVEELKAARAAGRKAVGYLCLYAPVELVRASGAIPVRLAHCDAGAEEAGGKYLRADACSFCKNCLGGFETDPLSRQVDAVVAVSTCDMMRRLPESIERYARVPSWTVYLPRTSEPLPERIAEFRRQLGLLQDWLAGLTGRRATDEGMDAAVAEYDRLRQLLRDLDEGRAEEPPPVSGSDVLNLTALTWLLDPAHARAVLEQEAADRPARANRPRLMLGGSLLAENDRWLVRMIEEKADIVADTLCT